MNSNFPTPYPELNAVLLELVAGIQEVLGENFIAAYLQGSFAIGDWDTDSDVDFIVALKQDVPDADLPALQALHGRIYDQDSPWAKHLEGSYFPREILRRHDPARTPLFFLDNTFRELIRSDHCNTRIVRWCVREHGITMVGPKPATLIDPVSADDLREEVREFMHTWAVEIFANPGQVENRWFQAYAVLTYCRMQHTLATGRIASKFAGAQWAKSALDARWVGLIERACAERPNPSLKVRMKAYPEDALQTFAFIRSALDAIP